jgi:hypothetical protein
MITSEPTPADARSPSAAEPGPPAIVAWYAEGFSDALGDRLRLFDNATTPMELLRFSPAALGSPGFEPTLRRRLDALAAFRHPAFATVRSLTVLDDPQPRLALVSELASGERLSALLDASRAARVRLDATCAIWLLRHLLPALASLHQATGGLQHGWLDPDRVVVTPSGDVVITEYVFWGLLGDVVDGPPRSDVCQSALLAAALLLGRPLRVEELRGDLAGVIEQACLDAPSGDVLRPWLLKAVARPPAGFRSAHEAYHALEELLPGVWGAWPARLLPGAPIEPVSLAPLLAPVAPVAPVAPPPRPTVLRALLLPGTTEPTTRRLAHVSRTLAAVAMLEAACIGFLVVQIATSDPAPAISAAPSIHAAGFLPPAAAMSNPDPAYALVPSDTPNPAEAVAIVPPAADTVLGFLVLEAPAEMKVYVNGRLMGYATRRRFGLPAGEHTVALVNDDLDYRSIQTVRIAAGRSVRLAPALFSERRHDAGSTPKPPAP